MKKCPIYIFQSLPSVSKITPGITFFCQTFFWNLKDFLPVSKSTICIVLCISLFAKKPFSLRKSHRVCKYNFQISIFFSFIVITTYIVYAFFIHPPTCPVFFILKCSFCFVREYSLSSVREKRERIVLGLLWERRGNDGSGAFITKNTIRGGALNQEWAFITKNTTRGGMGF